MAKAKKPVRRTVFAVDEALIQRVANLEGLANHPFAQDTGLSATLRDMNARIAANEDAICPRVAARQTALEKDAIRGARDAVMFEERLSALEKQEAATAAHVVKLLMAQRAAGKERLMADLRQDIILAVVKRNRDGQVYGAQSMLIARLLSNATELNRVALQELIARLTVMAQGRDI